MLFERCFLFKTCCLCLLLQAFVICSVLLLGMTRLCRLVRSPFWNEESLLTSSIWPFPSWHEQQKGIAATLKKTPIDRAKIFKGLWHAMAMVSTQPGKGHQKMTTKASNHIPSARKILLSEEKRQRGGKLMEGSSSSRWFY